MHIDQNCLINLHNSSYYVVSTVFIGIYVSNIPFSIKLLMHITSIFIFPYPHLIFNNPLFIQIGKYPSPSTVLQKYVSQNVRNYS